MESLNVGNAGFPVVENGARAGAVPVESDQRVRFVDDELGVIQRMQMLRTLNDRHLLGISREHLEETRAVAAQRRGVFHHDTDAIARTGDEKTAEAYLKLFCEKSETPRQYVQKWIPIVAASQSVKGKPEERELLFRWVDVVDYE